MKVRNNIFSQQKTSQFFITTVVLAIFSLNSISPLGCLETETRCCLSNIFTFLNSCMETIPVSRQIVRLQQIKYRRFTITPLSIIDTISGPWGLYKHATKIFPGSPHTRNCLKPGTHFTAE